MDRDFGLIHVMVQTWFPMRMQVFVNGHNWLANKLAASGIKFTQCDKVFLWLEDLARAQRFADRLTLRLLVKSVGSLRTTGQSAAGIAARADAILLGHCAR